MEIRMPTFFGAFEAANIWRYHRRQEAKIPGVDIEVWVENPWKAVLAEIEQQSKMAGEVA
jgi:hypothetical protein